MKQMFEAFSKLGFWENFSTFLDRWKVEIGRLWCSSCFFLGQGLKKKTWVSRQQRYFQKSDFNSYHVHTFDIRFILWQRFFFGFFASYRWHHVLFFRERHVLPDRFPPQKSPAWGRWQQSCKTSIPSQMRAGYLQNRKMKMKATKANRWNRVVFSKQWNSSPQKRWKKIGNLM